MESQIEELLKRHPNLDRMMCETLLKLHEQGKLETYMEKLEEKPGETKSFVQEGITVENPEINSVCSE